MIRVIMNYDTKYNYGIDQYNVTRAISNRNQESSNKVITTK
jgi:hypothetical protein